MLLTVFLASLHVTTPAVVLAAEGDVTALVPGKTIPLTRSLEVPAGAIVSTGKDSRVSLRLASGSLITLGADTQVMLSELDHTERAGERKEGLKLIAGRLWAKVTRLFGNSRFAVETENAVAGVRGTEFGINRQKSVTTFVLGRGVLDVKLGDQDVTLDQPGATATLTDGSLAAGGTWSASDVRQLARGAGSFDAGAAFGGEPSRDLGSTPQRILLGPDVLIDAGLGVASAPQTAAPGPAFLDVTVELK